MADVRALLKSKRQEQRITHPYASYTQSGQLRCKACDMVIKYASAWNGHVGSKGHRTAVAKLKEEEALAAFKRKQDIAFTQDDADEDVEFPAKKRKLDEENHQSPASGLTSKAADFPSDFFSDPSRRLYTQDDTDEVEEDGHDAENVNTKLLSQKQPNGKTAGDEDIINREWAEFQASILNEEEKEVATVEVFERATIFAEPELADELPQGIPEFAASKKVQAADPAELKKAEQPPDEAEALSRRQEEDRELIMDRLLEEERLQEEADERVSILKSRLELIRQRRTLAKKSKQS